MTSDLLPVEEGREMAVDEDMEAKEKKMREEVKRNVEESRSSLPRRPPPTWEEWKLSASRKARGAEDEVRLRSRAAANDSLHSGTMC